MRTVLTILAAAVLLAGCGASGATSSQASPAPQPTTAPQAPQETATMPTPSDEADMMAQMARRALAERLGVAEETIQVTRVEQVEWADGSLGCPQPGMMYPQVITPGYRVVLEHGGQPYTYHTDMGRQAQPCEAGLTQ